MIFQRELQLSYDISTLTKHVEPGQVQGGHGPIVKLSYSEDARAKTPAPVQTIKDVFVQTMNQQVVHKTPRGATDLPKLLAFVSDLWRKAGLVAEEYRLLSLHYPTQVNLTQEDALSIRSTILLPGLGTKLQLTFEVSLLDEESQSSIKISSQVAIVYGEQLAPLKMQEFLARRVGRFFSISEEQKERRWVTAVKELCGKL